MSSVVSPGRLLVVGTPIGNLEDMTPRAAAALAGADVVACEDTRRTGRLLAHLGVRAPELVRLDAHTEERRSSRLVDRLLAGDDVALVSDAGMPALSDPGAVLVDRAHDAGVPVEVLPGPFAAAVALVASGLAETAGRFVFEGFLPRGGRARSDRLADLAGEPRAVVLYEAPHRLAATLSDLAAAMGEERRVAVCRELTKLHEEVVRTTLGDAARSAAEPPPRGEHVVVVAPAPPSGEVDDSAVVAAVAAELDAGATRRDAAAAVARRLGVAPNRVKRLAADAPPRRERD